MFWFLLTWNLLIDYRFKSYNYHLVTLKSFMVFHLQQHNHQQSYNSSKEKIMKVLRFKLTFYSFLLFFLSLMIKVSKFDPYFFFLLSDLSLFLTFFLSFSQCTYNRCYEQLLQANCLGLFKETQSWGITVTEYCYYINHVFDG